VHASLQRTEADRAKPGLITSRSTGWRENEAKIYENVICHKDNDTFHVTANFGADSGLDNTG
jgi:hypothetical protein